MENFKGARDNFMKGKPIRTKDGIELFRGALPIPEKTFFYQRTDGTIFMTPERDAARIHRKFRFIGTSNLDSYCEKIKALFTDSENYTLAEFQEKMRDALTEEVEISKGKMELPVLKRINLNSPNQIDLAGFKDRVW